jgi:PD-(D/E)XK nuclease superfamily
MISGQLIEFLDRTPLPWLNYNKEKDKLIMVVDNHLMSTYRACPQHFIYAHVDGYKRKGINVSGVQRNWFLDFGVILHKMLEDYYIFFREPHFDVLTWSTDVGPKLWKRMDMDVHCEHKEYKLIGGVHGFVGLLIQYATVLSPQNEKLRVLGTEVSFGKNLEVPLYLGDDFEVYLAGRMDVIVDDGYFICPMDHKTMGTFRGDPALRFEIDEGPTGYIFALKTVLPQFISADEVLKRDCSKILMNLICKTPPATPIERFKRIAIRKTDYQLMEYQLRMIATAKHILEDINKVAQGLPVYRNTQVCHNWMHLDCAYVDIDRQQSEEAALMTIKNGFVKAELWDTETVSN